jgi:prepilin-type N-terminal cleavage/methylation domain-containing protein
MQTGFTLIELLVATSVLAILILLLFSFFSQATHTWKSSESKVNAYSEARAALYYLSHDLQNARITSRIPFYKNPAIDNNGDGSFAPPEHGDKIFFITTSGSDAQDPTLSNSDLCAVGYYIAYTSPSNGINRGAYNLHRYFKSSNTTWSNATGGLLALMSDPNALLFPSANATRSTGGDEIIARNVIDFFIQRYTGDADPIQLDDGDYHTQPAFFDISLRAYNYDTAQKFTSAQDWTNSNTMETVKSQNAQLFRLRVNLNP